MIALSLAIFTGCGKKEDPLERERRELAERLKGTKVSLYIGFKVALRGLPRAQMTSASNREEREKVVESANTAWDARDLYLLGFDLLSRESNTDTTAYTAETWSIGDYWTFAKEFYELEKALEKVDEDEFPTILQNLQPVYDVSTGTQSDFAWYTNSHEHALLAVLLLASQQAPAELAFYEVSLLRPAELEDPILVLGSYAVRSAVFMKEDYNYLSEYEATMYLSAVDVYRDALIAQSAEPVFGGTNANSDEQKYAQYHLPGALLRGVARYRIGDEEGSMEDLGAFLQDAETIGLEGEIVWAIGAYVSLYQEDNARALSYLGKLKQSEVLGNREKEFVTEIEGYVNEREPGKAMNMIFDKWFMGELVVKMIVSYAGDVDWHQQIESTGPGKALFNLGDDLVEEYNQIAQYVTPDGLAKQGEALLEKGDELKEKGKDLFKGVKGFLQKDSTGN